MPTIIKASGSACSASPRRAQLVAVPRALVRENPPQTPTTQEQAHHIRWRSGGGDDALANFVLSCPNHHRAIHRCDLPFDFVSNAFSFAAMMELSKLLQHTFAED